MKWKSALFCLVALSDAIFMVQIVMNIIEITVAAHRTFNHPHEDYSNLRPGLSLKATLSPEEDTDKAVKALQAKAEELIESHKRALLASIEDLYRMTAVQAELCNLEDSLRRAQERIETLRAEQRELSATMLSENNP